MTTSHDTTRTVAVTIPGSPAVANAALAYAARNREPWFSEPDYFEVAVAHAYRLANAYPVADDAVEVVISPEALTYAMRSHGGDDLLTADSIAEQCATVMLDNAAEVTGVPLSRGHITTVAPGVLRLRW